MNVSGIKAQVITGMPTSHSSTSQVEEMAMKRVLYIKDLEEEIDSKMRLYNAINSIYFYLKEPARQIIELRYITVPIGRRKYNWQEIAEMVGYSEKVCYNIDGKIIRSIQRKLLDSVCGEVLQDIHSLLKEKTTA
jgi:DNA-directed RNA polymerase specialized sigma subunit